MIEARSIEWSSDMEEQFRDMLCVVMQMTAPPMTAEELEWIVGHIVDTLRHYIETGCGMELPF